MYQCVAEFLQSHLSDCLICSFGRVFVPPVANEQIRAEIIMPSIRLHVGLGQTTSETLANLPVVCCDASRWRHGEARARGWRAKSNGSDDPWQKFNAINLINTQM